MFVSWIHHHGRSAALARALGVPAVFVAVGRRGNRLTVPYRYVVQAVRTVRLLARERPAVLYVMAPPLPLVAIGLLHQALTGSPLVVDAHTGAVVADGPRPKRAFALLARRARATVVTTERLAGVLRRHGAGPVIVLHDPPHAESAPERVPHAGGSERARPLLVMPSSWYRDEPLEAVRDAASRVAHVDVVLTGTPTGPLADPAAWPSNVRLAGWLDAGDYAALLDEATGVVALTTRDLTMQRGGYEALILGKPAVVSDTTVLREYFTQGAVLARHEPSDLARAFEACVDAAPGLAREMEDLRARKQAEFAEGLQALAAAVAVG